MLKNDGRSKRKKTKIKCDSCKGVFELDNVEIIKLEKLSYVECPYCGLEIILKNS